VKKQLAHLAATLVLLARLSPAQAQTIVPAAYSGPRFPGGPDSLRAFVGRSTRQVMAAPAGRMLVQFELKPDGQPYNFTMVRPPEPLNRALVDATAKALDYLAARMPAWQPAPPDPDNPPSKKEAPKVQLVIDFGAPAASQPYCYADQNPVFGTLVQALPTRQANRRDKLLADPARLARFQSSLLGLVSFVQLQVMYPAEALRNRQQGTVYASFEVAETGTVEHVEILGTAGRALDAEVLRAVQQLPAATAPAQFRGRPVRVRYVLPVNFRIQ